MRFPKLYRLSKVHKGFAFIEFPRARDVKKALKLDRSNLEGSTIRVRPKHDDNEKNTTTVSFAPPITIIPYIPTVIKTGLEIPEYWTFPYTDPSSTYKRAPLAPSHEEYQSLHSLFNKTCSTYTVTSIDVVQVIASLQGGARRGEKGRRGASTSHYTALVV